MSEIAFDKEGRAVLVERLRRWFGSELDQELGEFPAGFLLDFLTEELGPCWYNLGLLDARAAFELRMDSIGEAVHELEKPTPFDRGAGR